MGIVINLDVFTWDGDLGYNFDLFCYWNDEPCAIFYGLMLTVVSVVVDYDTLLLSIFYSVIILVNFAVFIFTIYYCIVFRMGSFIIFQ